MNIVSIKKDPWKRDFFDKKMVRVEGVEPSSLPWEGSIIAVIRYSLM